MNTLEVTKEFRDSLEKLSVFLSSPTMKRMLVADEITSGDYESLADELEISGGGEAKNVFLELVDKVSSCVKLIEEIKVIQGEKGDKGDRGERGEQGIQGLDGKDGKPGKNGKDGKDGRDGKDGKNAQISIEEMIKELNKLKEIFDWKLIKNPPAQKVSVNDVDGLGKYMAEYKRQIDQRYHGGGGQFKEVLAIGTIDGTNKDFTIPEIVGNAAEIWIFRGGNMTSQLAGDYTFTSGKNISFSIPPQVFADGTKEVVLIKYRR